MTEGAPESRPTAGSAGSDVRVLDVFCYNGDPIVTKRLEYLASKIDTFVVVEARETHSGRPKDGLFVEKNADLFAKYDCEIVVVDAFPPPPPDWADVVARCPWVRDPTAWWREFYQRECALPAMRRLAGTRPTVALVCDADEIPSHDTIDFLKANYRAISNHPVHVQMDVFYYSFDWRMPNEKWHKAFAACTEFLGKPIALTKIRNSRPVAVMDEGAGWHCSYFMDPATIRRKLESFAHTEVTVPDDIQKIVEEGRDIAGRPTVALQRCYDPPPF